MEMLRERLTVKEIALLQKGIAKSGIVEVRLKNPKKTGSITLRDYFEEDDFGSRTHRPLIDSNGNERVIKYTQKKVLNLTRENDRLEYAHLLDHPLYIKGANPVLDLVNYESEADDFVTMKDNEARANELISKLSGSKLRDLARVLQIVVRNGSSEKVLKRALYEYAAEAKAPGSGLSGSMKIVSEVDNPEYESKVRLYRAIESKTVRNANGRYFFGQVPLGTTFDISLAFLIANPDIESELEKELKSL